MEWVPDTKSDTRCGVEEKILKEFWKRCLNRQFCLFVCFKDFFFLDVYHFYGEGNGTPLQCSCLENPMDREAWWAAVHAVAKSRTRLSDFTFTFHFHALEKEMAIHSSIPAWRIPGTGEPGGLQSMGSHRVPHDWSDLAAAAGPFLKSFLNLLQYCFCLRFMWDPSSLRRDGTHTLCIGRRGLNH